MSGTANTDVVYQTARMYLATVEPRERDRTDIRTLRMRWNEAQGYYIEITLAALSQRAIDDPDFQLPDDYAPLSGFAIPNVCRFRTADLAANEAIVMAVEQ